MAWTAAFRVEKPVLLEAYETVRNPLDGIVADVAPEWFAVMSRLTTLFRRRTPARPDESVGPPLGPHLPRVADGFPLVLCWSPKAGCTTILRWFLFHTGRLAESDDAFRRPHFFWQQQLDRQPGYEAMCRAALTDGRRPVVKVVRDPATRAVSSYFQALRSASWNDPGPWESIQRWKVAAGIGGPEGLSLEQMLLYVLSPRIEGEWIDGHCAEQWNQAHDRHVTDFVRMEELTDALRRLELRFGLAPSPLDRLSRSPHHHRITPDHGWPTDPARFVAPADAIRRLGVPPAEPFLDEHTRALIRTAYRRDYIAYGTLYDEHADAVPVPASGQ